MRRKSKRPVGGVAAFDRFSFGLPAFFLARKLIFFPSFLPYPNIMQTPMPIGASLIYNQGFPNCFF